MVEGYGKRTKKVGLKIELDFTVYVLNKFTSRTRWMGLISYLDLPILFIWVTSHRELCRADLTKDSLKSRHRDQNNSRTSQFTETTTEKVLSFTVPDFLVRTSLI